jgi:hypothetical protein
MVTTFCNMCAIVYDNKKRHDSGINSMAIREFEENGRLSVPQR